MFPRLFTAPQNPPESLPPLPSDLQGPNPFAAMAAILVLSESVGDVEDLVLVLRRCISLTAVTEFLSHMATMLLALNRNRVQISNK